jgi:hypothetical protein
MRKPIFLLSLHPCPEPSPESCSCSVLAESESFYSLASRHSRPSLSLAMPFASLRSTVILATALTFLVSNSVASPALPPSLRSHSADSRHDHQVRYVYGFDTRYSSKRGLTASHWIDQDASPALAFRSTSQDPITSLKPSFNKSMSSSKQLSEDFI